MWVTRRELRRIERERSEAIKRAALAESRLQSERERFFRILMRCADAVFTSKGRFAVSDPEPKLIETPKDVKPLLSISREQFFEDGHLAGKGDSQIEVDWKNYELTGYLPFESAFADESELEG